MNTYTFTSVPCGPAPGSGRISESKAAVSFTLVGPPNVNKANR